MSIIRPMLVDAAIAASRVDGAVAAVPDEVAVRDLQRSVGRLMREMGGVREAIAAAERDVAWFARVSGDGPDLRPVSQAARAFLDEPGGSAASERLAALAGAAPPGPYRVGLAPTADAYEGLGLLERVAWDARRHAAAGTAPEEVAEEIWEAWAAGARRGGAFTSREDGSVALSPALAQMLRSDSADAASTAAFVTAHELRHAANPVHPRQPFERVNWFQEGGASLAATHDIASMPQLPAGLDRARMLATASDAYQQHVARVQDTLAEAGRPLDDPRHLERFADDFARLDDVRHLDELASEIAARTGASTEDVARRLLAG